MTSTVIFEPDRLRQARQLAMRTKRELAESSSVSAAAISQYEAGISVPRPETVERLAHALDVPEEFFGAGRPLQRLETSDTYFESLRTTTSKQRQSATALAEQVWELAHTLEGHVRFPDLDLAGFEVDCDSREARTPQAAAAQVRARWGLGSEPIGHLVSHIESHGVVCALAPSSEQAVARIDAYSTHSFGRPVMVLTPDRVDDVFRHRFSAAHELGHLVLHAGHASGETLLEREANSFAAEFLTPSHVMRDLLPSRMDFSLLYRVSEKWGVSVRTLVYRSRELGLISESTARRAYIRLAQAPPIGRPVRLFEGEVPSMLSSALELAAVRGVTVASLASELKWKPRRVRELLGEEDPRPRLSLVPS